MSYPERRSGGGGLTGKWIGEVNLPRVPRRRRTCETKSEADGYEAYVRASGGEEPTHNLKNHTGVTFREVAALCKEAGGPKRARWKAGRDKSVHQRLEFIVGVLGDLDISAVGTLELDAVVEQLQRRPGYQGRRLSAGTINRYLTAASAVLTFASSRGYIQGKPVIPLQEEDGEREATVSDDLEAAILKWLTDNGHPEVAICVRVLIETGMRAGELHGLNAEQIENEWIRLKASQVKTKTARTVWIDPELARDFRALVAAGKRPHAKQLARMFKLAVESCGGNSELVIHSLRHTRATRLLEAGVDPQVTLEMMGWTSFNTMKRYRHVKPSMHVEAAKKVTLNRRGNPENGEIVPFVPKNKAG